MIAASFLGIFVIPGLYVLFQTLRERLKPAPAAKLSPPATGEAVVADVGPAGHS